MTVTRIPGLGTKFTLRSKYQVFAVVVLQNNGLDGSALQSYFNGGDPQKGDPFFMTLQTKTLNVTLVGRVLIAHVTWTILNTQVIPHIILL